MRYLLWMGCRLYVQVDTVSPVRGSKLGAAQLALARKILSGAVIGGQVTLFSTF